jgi:hypothetical protein
MAEDILFVLLFGVFMLLVIGAMILGNCGGDRSQ